MPGALAFERLRIHTVQSFGLTKVSYALKEMISRMFSGVQGLGFEALGGGIRAFRCTAVKAMS